MRLGKRVKLWHVSSGCLKCSDDVFRESNRVKFEVCLEEKVNNVVYAPICGTLPTVLLISNIS